MKVDVCKDIQDEGRCMQGSLGEFRMKVDVCKGFQD